MSLTAVADAPATDSAPDRAPDVVRFPGPGLMSRVIAAALAIVVRPVIAAFARWPHAPWPFSAVNAAGLLLPRPRQVYRRTLSLPNCRAEMIVPKAARPGGAILYLHGGGFITCGLNTHRRLAADIACAAGWPALSVDYRQLMRARLAEALDDAVDGFRELLARGHSPGDIRLVGDSAGGYLALATALAVQRRGLGRPGAVALMSPVTSVDADSPALIDLDDPLLTAPTLRAIYRMLADDQDAPDHLVPAHELANLPPTLIQVGTREVVYTGALVLAGQLAATGVPSQLQVWQGQFHAFQAAALVMGHARHAVAEIGAFLRDSSFSPRRPEAGGGIHRHQVAS